MNNAYSEVSEGTKKYYQARWFRKTAYEMYALSLLKYGMPRIVPENQEVNPSK